MRLPSLLVVILLGAGAAWLQAEDKPAVEAKPAASLDGTWKLVSSVEGGEAIPDAMLQQVTAKLVLSGKSYRYEMNGTELEQGSFTCDESASPKSIDFLPSDGEDKGKTIKGIYRFDDGKLAICADLSGKDRPGEFASTANSKIQLSTYRMEKQ